MAISKVPRVIIYNLKKHSTMLSVLDLYTDYFTKFAINKNL